MAQDSGIKTPLLIEVHQRTAADKTFRFTLVDAFTGLSVLTCEGMKAEGPTMSRFAVNRSETMIAVVGKFSSERCLQLWDRISGQRLARLKPPPHDCTTLSFSPDGKFLAAFYVSLAKAGKPRERGVVLYDLRREKIRAEIKLPEVSSPYDFPPLAFSPDSRLLLVRDGWEIKVWRIPDEWRRER